MKSNLVNSEGLKCVKMVELATLPTRLKHALAAFFFSEAATSSFLFFSFQIHSVTNSQMWKFHVFSITQILREIDFGSSENA